MAKRKVVYLGPSPAIVLAREGIECEKGVEVEVDAELADRLLERSDFETAASSTSGSSGKSGKAKASGKAPAQRDGEIEEA